MRVTLACDYPRDERLGSAKVPLREAEELERLGVRVRCLFAEDLPRVGSARLQQLTSPVRMAAALERHARDSEVVDIAGFDAWLYARSVRALRRPQAVVARSNGFWFRVVEMDQRFHPKSGLRRLASAAFQEQVLCNWERSSLIEADVARTGSGADRDEIVRRGWKASERVISVNPAADAAFDGGALLEERQGLVYLGSWLPRKGADTVRTAVANLLARHPSLAFMAAGTGVPAEHILPGFPEAVRQRIQVIPSASPAELAAIAGRSAIMLFPTIYEGFGIVTVEGMRAGLAVVTTPTGAGLDYVRDEQNGLLVDPDDPRALEAAAERLVRDPALRIRLARQARADASRHTWAIGAKQLLAGYEQALRFAAKRCKE